MCNLLDIARSLFNYNCNNNLKKKKISVHYLTDSIKEIFKKVETIMVQERIK